jgi:Flp pilus assembly protein TadD/cell division protein FtsN
MKTNHRARPSFRTAVSILALALGLSACAGGSSSTSPASQVAKDKNTLLLRIADETAAGGDPATAVGLYRQLHQASPKDPVPLTRLATVLAGMREYRAAADAYRAAVALDGDNADLHRGLAATLLASGDADGSLAELRTALSKRPDDPRLYNLLGVAQDMSGRHDLAQQTYQHGLDLAPANLGLRNNYAMSLALSGDFADAITRFAEIAGPAAQPRYRLNLALAYGLAGDEAKAAATAREVLDEASVKSNLDHYALLRGMDEDRRTAAIFGAELGGGIPVADASAKPRATAVADNRPTPAPAMPVVASKLPPLLPVEGAAPARHVASLADRPADKVASARAEPAPQAAETTVTPQVASDMPAAATDLPKHAKKRLAKAAVDPKPAVPAAEAPKPIAAASDQTKPMEQASVDPKPAAPEAEAPKPIADMAVAPTPVASTADAPPPPAFVLDEPKQLAKASGETKPISEGSEQATSPPLSLVPPQMPAAQKESAAADQPAPAPADAQSAPSPMPETHSELASPLDGGPIAAPVAGTADVAPSGAPSTADLSPDTVAMLHQFLDTVMAPTAAAGMTSPAAPAKAEPAVTKPGPISRHHSVERFTVQLGSFQTEETARRLADNFAAKGIVVSVSRANDRSGNDWYVIRSGEFASADDANALVTQIQSIGGAPVVIRHRIPDTTPAI